MGELKHMDAENWREVCAQFRGLFLRPDEFKFTDEELQQYGMTAIATAHIDDRKQVENCLRKITLSSKHLLGLINDVLDMSKIESGKLTLTTEQISLKEVVEGIVNIMQPQVKTKKQTFDIHVENIFTENVWCDGIRLNQVLLNLLSNATKYTPEGGSIQLSLSEEKSPKGENYVRIHINVRDNGIGMSPEFLKRIYESHQCRL